jgi:Transposase
MRKYTQEQKIEALKFFEDGFSAREIFEVLEIPIGTLYRWKSEDSKPQQTVAEGDELLQLRDKVEQLESKTSYLEKYIDKLERAKEGSRDYEDFDKPKLIFGKKHST